MGLYSLELLVLMKTSCLQFSKKLKIIQIKHKAFIPYGRINRSGTPKTSGFYILHEGPIAVLNERLIEIDYDDLLEKKVLAILVTEDG